MKRKLVQYGEDGDNLHNSHDYPNKSSMPKSTKTSEPSHSSKGKSHPRDRPEVSSGFGSSNSSDSLNTLMEALDKVLYSTPESTANLLQQLGEEGYKQCKSLQLILHRRSNKGRSNGTPKTPNHIDRSQKLAGITHPTSLTPWTASSIPSTTPPLPKILDPILEKQAFTHSAINEKLSYERLEWVGDIYIELTATLLISSTFPDLLVGRCSQLRERLVKNDNLASYSSEYGFERRAFLPLDFRRRSEKEQTKAMGDMFEAYCAAIIYSDPENGVNRLTNWLKDLFARTLSYEISAIEPKEQVKFENPKNILPKELLSTKLTSKGIKLLYRDAAPEKIDTHISGHPVFTIGVYLDGWGANGKLLGIGTGLSKKEAGTRAAEAALANRELFIYEGRKREYDAKRRAEEANNATPANSTGDA